MSSLQLPEPIKVSKNLAHELDELEKKGETIVTICGYSNIESLFYLYLIKKYKSKCVTKKTKLLDKQDTLLGMSINIKMKLTREEEAEMREQFVNLAKTLTKCIKKGEETIIIPLNYYKGLLRVGHSNVLIYRRRTNVIEHFEPHGGLFKQSEKEQANIERKIDFFIRIFNAELKKDNMHAATYVAATNVCPYLWGLQTLEANSVLKKDKGEPGGYCSIWSMFFAELCLKNPDKSSEEILENIYNYLTTKENAKNYLKKVIRGYSGYIVESVNTYLKIFFKPTYTVLDIIDFTRKHMTSKKYDTLMHVIRILLDLEAEILLDDDYDLEAELSRVKRMYKRSTKGMTVEQQRAVREKSEGIRFLYYQKRILQNYEEYSNYGKISEPLADSPLELMKDTMTNKSVLDKRRAKTQKASSSSSSSSSSEPEPKQVTKAKTQRRRLSPNTIQKREKVENEKLLAKIIKKYKIDVSTKAGQDELYRLVLSLKEK
jgi:hypothetical protein